MAYRPGRAEEGQCRRTGQKPAWQESRVGGELSGRQDWTLKLSQWIAPHQSVKYAFHWVESK